jgi:kynurenine formamidase
MPGLMSIVDSANASADDPPSFEEHTALLEKEIVVIEGLSNLDALVGLSKVVFVGFPIKLEGGTGGPMRAVGLVY